jgi:hypothetical protein
MSGVKALILQGCFLRLREKGFALLALDNVPGKGSLTIQRKLAWITDRLLEPYVLVAHSELTDQPNLMLFIQIPT